MKFWEKPSIEELNILLTAGPNDKGDGDKGKKDDDKKDPGGPSGEVPAKKH